MYHIERPAHIPLSINIFVHCIALEDIQIKYGQKCMILSINVKHYVEIQNNENAQDWFSLEAKLCEGDVLVHIVLGLVHPRQLDLF